MKTLFHITFNIENAIDLVEFYGYAHLSIDDISTLVYKHTRYIPTVEQVCRIPEIEYRPLSAIIKDLEKLVFHKEVMYVTRIIDGYDTINIKITDSHLDSEELLLDLSGGDFVSLKCDRTAMLEENRNVYNLMKALFDHGHHFEFYGSRAKIKIPLNHHANRDIVVHKVNHVWGHSFITLDCPKYKMITNKAVEEL